MMRFPKGFTLLSLIVGIGTGALLLLTIVQLSSISHANFLKNQNTVQIYVDARNAIELLRRYVPMAGVGIEQPTSAQTSTSSSASAPTPGLMLYSANTTYDAAHACPGGIAALRDWVYVGMCTGITIGTTPSYGPYVASGDNPNQPLWCATQVSTNAPTANFMALLQKNCYYGTNPGWGLAEANVYYQGLCCGNPGNNGTTTCSGSATCANPTYPIYSCGASNGSGGWAASLYQKLVQHVIATTAPANNNAGGDQLTVNFANRGPQSLTSYDGTSISADLTKPPALHNYTFSVNNANATLQMTDAGSAKTYTVANNVEYMAVLVGESDRIQSSTVTSSQPMQLPEMNRYVRFNAANLYPYRITAVRIGLVVRSNDNVLSSAPVTPTALTVMTGSDNNPITYTPPADRRLHKVFVTTIYLHSYALPEFRMNCTPLPSGAASPASAQLQTGGIPFTTNAVTANDQCCGGACSSYPSYNACETQRMTNGC